MAIYKEHRPGTLSFVELVSTDPNASREFYSTLFGWKIHDEDMGEHGIYTQFLKEGEAGTHHMLGLSPEAPCCGMMQISPEMGPIPPHWLAYFQVDDLETTLARAAGLGAVEVVPTTHLPGGSRFAICADPQGAHLGLFQKGEES
jgi:uncharacterized protein